MKDLAVPQEAEQEQEASSAFERFAKAMRALVSVPKRDLEEKLAEHRLQSKSRRAGISGPRGKQS